ncbi:MAG: sulfurtransferase TusA family protein [Deltaproteobacteria bacterium]|jgi:TusA-related sulfurtransferase|uniref:Sulfurtransferase TusA family protein n=1 Tax=Candidatus Acididesulfobacter diazotrophicus TaxID=2597226 RepID=A0A519BLD4_9DELT|nr:sulfurtransferase TusA family protein [Deltaproteobacteria bacterium]RZD18049.1 MAG: sulfurtransferase TusA family protein [Candidatus Acididesulfobacter diazotrophicus]
MNYDYELDTYGLSCPVPIMKVAEEFKKIPDGSVLKVIASDQGIIEDLKSYCKKTCHEFLSYDISGSEYIVYVKK